MTKEAMLPCFTCGKILLNIWADQEDWNQPSEGTEFITYGHYGSTFWDSLDGEQLVLNICDNCLRKNTKRLAKRRQRRQKWVNDLMVPYDND